MFGPEDTDRIRYHWIVGAIQRAIYVHGEKCFYKQTPNFNLGKYWRIQKGIAG